MRTASLRVAACLSLASALPGGAAEGADEPRPNVVLIGLEWVGVGDLACFGGPFPTPHLDALAADGIRFSRFTTASVDYYAGAENFSGHTVWNIGFDRHPDARQRLPYAVPQEILRDDGYHLVHATGGWAAGEVSRVLGLEKEKYDGPSILAAVRAWDGRRPLLLSWSTGLPFNRLYAHEGRAAEMKGRFDAGPVAVAEGVRRRQVEMGLYPADKGWTNPVPRLLETLGKSTGDGSVMLVPDAQAGRVWHYWPARGFSKGRFERFEQPMEFWAALMGKLDAAIGDVVAVLKEKGRYDDTLFLVCGNGGAAGHHGRHGPIWSAVSATPFVGETRGPEAGGRVAPLIAAWPARTRPERRGAVVRHMVCSLDLAPTMLAAAGSRAPETNTAGERLVPFDGRSLLPAFDGALGPAEKPYFASERQSWRGVFGERWSAWGPLVEDSTSTAKWKLFDLDADPFERTDVASDHPELVQEAVRRWCDWERTRCALRPWDWRRLGKTWREEIGTGRSPRN